jgi:hypothetical protein
MRATVVSWLLGALLGSAIGYLSIGQQVAAFALTIAAVCLLGLCVGLMNHRITKLEDRDQNDEAGSE